MVLGLAKNIGVSFRCIFDRHGCREIAPPVMIFTFRLKFDATVFFLIGNEGKPIIKNINFKTFL